MTSENKTIAKFRETLSERELQIYQTGLTSIATDASRAARKLGRTLEKLRNEMIYDLSELYDTPDVSNARVRQEYLAIRRKMAEVEWDLTELGMFGFITIESSESMVPLEGQLQKELDRLENIYRELEQGVDVLGIEASAAARCA